MDPFEEVLKELGARLQVELEVDDRDACKLELEGKYPIQMEVNYSTNQLVIGSEIAVLGPGRYREDVLAAALQANGEPFPRLGTFGYSTVRNSLVYYALLPMDFLDGEKLHACLLVFLGTVRKWMDTLEGGDIPRPDEPAPGPSGFFGLSS
jgi:hypothetical protein